MIHIDSSVRLRPLSVTDYYRMAEVGILGERENIELIDGNIVQMSPIGSLHASVVTILHGLLFEATRSRAIVRCQHPIRLDDKNEPQPDISVVVPRGDNYAKSHPVPSEVMLIVEVANTSLAYDRNIKIPLYARFGIPEFWLADLNKSQVEVFRRPINGEYQDRPIAKPGEIITMSALPDLQIKVSDIFK